MPKLPALPSVATAPISVLLIVGSGESRLEALLSEWVTFLNGLERAFEVLLVAPEVVELPTSLPERFARVQVVRYAGPPGDGAALLAALPRARQPLVFYAPCTSYYHPSNLKKLLRSIDGVHLVSGFRSGRPVPFIARALGVLNRAFQRAIFNHVVPPLPGWLGWRRHLAQAASRWIFGVQYRDGSCPCRLLRREILARIPIQSHGTFAHVEILAKANFLGCLLGEEVPLESVVPEAPSGSGAVLRDAIRLFNRPDFGPPVLAPPAPPVAVVIPPDSAS